MRLGAGPTPRSLDVIEDTIGERPTLYRAPSFSITARSRWALDVLFEEGIRIPMLKLFKAGQPNTDVFAVIEASVRLPHEVRGDIQSMVAANEVMSRELSARCKKHERPRTSA